MDPNKQKIKELIETTFYIVDKESNDSLFRLNPAQNKFLEDMTGRDQILKARQLGFSTLLMAIFTYDFLFKPNSVSMSISYETGAAQKLLDKVKHFIEPLGVPMRYNSRNEMYNEAMNSTFYIGTAGAVTTGRGSTIHNLHASEVAFYSDADTLMTGLLQSVPKEGRVILESTANGMGDYFHREWEKAINGEGMFTPHFFSWKEDPGYAIDREITLTPEEREMMQIYSLSRKQVAWMRDKKKEFKTDDEYNQEYPITPEVAFISSGNPVFDMKSLNEYMKQSKPAKSVGNLVGNKHKMYFEEAKNGYLSVWEMPKDTDEYVIGVDVGLVTDFTVAQVIKKTTCEVVATWRGRVALEIASKELERLGYFYNQALLGVERNNQGIAVLIGLQQAYYPNLYYREDVTDTGENTTSKLGWETNIRTKPTMVSDLGSFIRSRDLHVWNKTTIKELMTFVRIEDKKKGSSTGTYMGKVGAQAGCHDDEVMALALAIQLYRRSPTQRTKTGLVSFAVDSFGSNNDYGTYNTAFDGY